MEGWREPRKRSRARRKRVKEEEWWVRGEVRGGSRVRVRVMICRVVGAPTTTSTLHRPEEDQEGLTLSLVFSGFFFLLDLVLFLSLPFFFFSFYLIREQQLQPRETLVPRYLHPDTVRVSPLFSLKNRNDGKFQLHCPRINLSGRIEFFEIARVKSFGREIIFVWPSSRYVGAENCFSNQRGTILFKYF